MTQITTPVAVSNSGPVVVSKLLAIHDYWFGASARDSEATIAGSVGRLSELLSGTSFVALLCGEERTTYLPKLNALNDPTAFIVDTSFGADEDGSFWGDLSEVFTDTAGTTPATWGNSVARINDQSPNERNAVQASAALRPLLGRAPVDVRNMFRHTDAFENVVWEKTRISVQANVAIAPNGSATADKLIETAETGTKSVLQNNALISGQTYTQSVYAKRGELNTLQIASSTGFPTSYVNFNLETGQIVGSGNLAATIEDVGDGWYRCAVTATADTTTSGGRFVIVLTRGQDSRLPSYTGDGVSGLFLWRAQFEEGPVATGDQRVITRLDITEAGVPSPAFLRFDLSDDVMPTAFPDGGTFDVLVAGRGGQWIERDVEIAAGGTLNIGPNEFTGTSTRLLLNVLGDIVGWTCVDRTIDPDELNRLVQYHRGREAKGLLVPGPDELSPFTEGFSGFSALTSGWTVSGNNLICAPGASALNLPIVPTGAEGMYQFILGFDDSHTAAGSIAIRFSAAESARTTFSASDAAAGQFTTAIRGVDGAASFRFRPSGGANFVITSLSARKMVPQEEL